MIDEFFTNNIEIKKRFLQEEHKRVLGILYKNGLEQGSVEGFEFVHHFSQCMRFTDVLEESGLNMQIVITCISDLESMGFLVNVMTNSMKEDSYGITWLGLKYMELVNKQESENNL